MPYEIKKSDQCPADKAWGVFKKDGGKLIACHLTKELAQKSIEAIYADEQKSASTTDVELRSVERRSVDPAELRFTEPTDSAPARVSGYAARFDVVSHPVVTTRGSFREKIQKGAFAGVLASGDNVVFRAEHGTSGQLPLADTATKTLRLSEDDVGLRFEADLDPSDPDVQALIPKMRRGTLRSMSFAFRVARGGDAWERRDGELHRTITAVSALKDVSPVTFPAYPETELALRSLEAWEAEHPELRDSAPSDSDTPAAETPKYTVGQRVVMVPAEPECDSPWAPKGSVGDIAAVSSGVMYSVDLGGYKVWVPESQLSTAVPTSSRSQGRTPKDETEIRRRRLKLHETETT